MYAWTCGAYRPAGQRAGPDSWHLFQTMGGPLGPANPVSHVQMSMACDKAWFGWPCDAELERLPRVAGCPRPASTPLLDRSHGSGAAQGAGDGGLLERQAEGLKEP